MFSINFYSQSANKSKVRLISGSKKSKLIIWVTAVINNENRYILEKVFCKLELNKHFILFKFRLNYR